MRVTKTKVENLATKILPGHIEKRRVRCGKPNCKCAKGKSHTAFYHVWYSDGQRFRKYIRRAKVETTRQSCESHRQLQAGLRIGRVEYKRMIRQFREILGSV